MSATILGCGHTSHLHLFDIDIIVTAPQVHLHFWTGEEEYEELGYGKVELCCHGCGASTLVYYMNEDKHDRHLQIRDEFTRKHARCPNRNYQSVCPDWRTSFKTVDIRQKKSPKWADSEPSAPLRRRRGPRKVTQHPPTPRLVPRVRKVPENGS